MRRAICRGVSATGAGRTAAASPRAALVSSPQVASGTARSPGRTAPAAGVRRIHVSAQRCGPTAAAAPPSEGYPTTHDKIENVTNTPYFLNNRFYESETDKFIDLPDPATNNLVTRVPQMTDAEMRAAVASSEEAFKSWRNTTVLHRQQIMFRFVQLIKDNMDRLAASITLEQGKTFADAKGDVLRGLQVAEAAVAGPELLKGEVLEVAKDMETRTYREPLGVVAAICPFSK